MLRLLVLAGIGIVLSGCEPQPKLHEVDLQGRLVVDEVMTSKRQAEGISGEYYKRVVTVGKQEMDFADFIKQFCSDSNTRDETCLKAFRIKKIDDVSGATKFLPNGLR